MRISVNIDNEHNQSANDTAHEYEAWLMCYLRDLCSQYNCTPPKHIQPLSDKEKNGFMLVLEVFKSSVSNMNQIVGGMIGDHRIGFVDSAENIYDSEKADKFWRKFENAKASFLGKL